MHRSLSALSILVVLAFARAASAGAHAKPQYTLERGKLVIEHDGIRDEMTVGCDATKVSPGVADDQLKIDCTDGRILVYSLEDPLAPKLRETASTPAHDTALVMRFFSTAPFDQIDRIACSLQPTSVINGEERPFDVRVGERRCSREPAPANAIPFLVEVRGLHERTIRLVVTPPNPEDAGDLRDALVEIKRVFESRLSTLRRSVEAYEEAGPKPPQDRWYGWQTLTLDLSGLVSCATIVLCPPGLGVWLFGTPIVHAVHGHAKRAWFSLALRGGPPLVGMGIGTLVGWGISCSNFRGGCGSRDQTGVGAGAGALIGGISSTIAATIVDAIISHDGPAKETSFMPFVAPTDRGAIFGAGGTF